MRSILFILITLTTLSAAQAQFAPQAGLQGSTAVFYTNADITGWATTCTIQRGLKDIALPDSGYVTQGDSSMGIGAADNFVVSLGDSGVAVMTFAQPIMDGAGADFLVFENGFRNPSDSEEAFMELAFVEVSSDGEHYMRFPATSAIQTDNQIAGSGVYMNAREVNNLAGKYVSKWGTPFDLADLPGDDAFLDPMHITHIRLIDVVGSLGAHGSKDKDGRLINDPYPTPFPTGGFDLDAVGVLHQATSVKELDNKAFAITVVPNPAIEFITIHAQKNIHVTACSITDVTGRVVHSQPVQNGQQIDVQALPTGYYNITILSKDGTTCSGSFIKH